MSPEQAEAKEADHRSDIFSFGCVFYELITGKRPFDGGSPASVIASILTAEPAPLASAQPLAPPALERVIRRCLAKDPDQRWQNVRDLREELKWISEAESEAPFVGSPRLRSPVVIAAIASALLAVAATATALWLWRSREPQQARPDRILLYRRDAQSGQNWLDFVTIPSSAGETDSRRLSVLPYSEQSARVSPDGAFLAFVSAQSSRDEVYVRSMDQSTGGKQVSEGGATQPRWRRDGRELYYTEGNSIMAVSVSSSGSSITLGKPQLLFTVDVETQWGFAVWPDGQRFLFPEPVAGSKPPSIRVVQNWSATFAPKRSD